MTPRQADKIISAGKPVTVRSEWNEVYTGVFTARYRTTIEAQDGRRFDRATLQLVSEADCGTCQP